MKNILLLAAATLLIGCSDKTPDTTNAADATSDAAIGLVATASATTSAAVSATGTASVTTDAAIAPPTYADVGTSAAVAAARGSEVTTDASVVVPRHRLLGGAATVPFTSIAGAGAIIERQGGAGTLIRVLPGDS